VKRIHVSATLEIPDSWTPGDVRQFMHRQCLSSQTERESLGIAEIEIRAVDVITDVVIRSARNPEELAKLYPHAYRLEVRTPAGPWRPK